MIEYGQLVNAVLEDKYISPENLPDMCVYGVRVNTMSNAQLRAAIHALADFSLRMPAMPTYNEPEPTPQKGKTEVWPLVIADMAQRNAVGVEKYGTPLKTHNGRNPLIDAYQEALYLCVYLRQAIEEMNS